VDSLTLLPAGISILAPDRRSVYAQLLEAILYVQFSWLSVPKTQSTTTGGLFTGASKGGGGYGASACSKFDGGANLGKILLPKNLQLHGRTGLEAGTESGQEGKE
jgi:hypothetical protein